MESLISKAVQIEDILIEGGGRPKRAFRETVKKNLFEMVFTQNFGSI